MHSGEKSGFLEPPVSRKAPACSRAWQQVAHVPAQTPDCLHQRIHPGNYCILMTFVLCVMYPASQQKPNSQSLWATLVGNHWGHTLYHYNAFCYFVITIFSGTFRAIGIRLHSRDFHTCSHNALINKINPLQMWASTKDLNRKNRLECIQQSIIVRFELAKNSCEQQQVISQTFAITKVIDTRSYQILMWSGTLSFCFVMTPFDQHKGTNQKSQDPWTFSLVFSTDN